MSRNGTLSRIGRSDNKPRRYYYERLTTRRNIFLGYWETRNLSMNEPLDMRAIIRRKSPELPRFVEIEGSALVHWNISATTPVNISIDGRDFGRRNLKPWGQGRDAWFLELTNEICNRAGIDTGDEVAMNVEMASTALPAELSLLIERDATAKKRWEQMTTSEQRILSDHVRQAKQATTRERRAVKALCS